MPIVIHKLLLTCNTVPYPPGFADYLRGTIALYQLSKVCGFELKIDISEHPISNYLLNDTININISTTEFFNCPITNIAEHILKYNNDTYISIETNCFPIETVSKDDIEFIKKNIKPNSILQAGIDDIINRLNIEDYNIVHIRSGDYELLKNTNYEKHNYQNIKNYDKFIMDINNIINENIISKSYNNNKTVVISDRKNIANMVANKFGFLTTQFTPIHIGALNINNEHTLLHIKETLVEFFLMERCSMILNIGGSGFSNMASIIFEKLMICYRDLY